MASGVPVSIDALRLMASYAGKVVAQ
jgi:hypothetical protein